jgi:hypothetical protein
MQQAGSPTLAIGLRINPYECRCRQNTPSGIKVSVRCATTGSDTYVFKGPDNFGEDTVQDCGGNSDSVKVSSTSFKLFDDDITVQRPNTYGGLLGRVPKRVAKSRP